MKVVLTAAALMVASAATAQGAADAHYDSEAMRAAREALYQSHGGGVTWMVRAERFEYLSGEGNPELVWDGDLWVGGDIHKFRFEIEGEYATDAGHAEELELQALYSRAIHPFWDLHAGIRHDVEPEPARSYAVVGVHGTAPYWFELDGAVFLSDEGDLSARLEVEYELRITQRLMLQPRIEVDAALSDDLAIGVASGFSAAQAGVRLRYEITREFAPYIGVSWSRPLGNTADLVPGDPASTSFVAGLRFWF